MLHKLRPHLTYSNVLMTLLAFAVVASGAVAIGGVTDGQGQIQACYEKKGPDQGEVRLLVSGKCTRQEKKIAWSQQGPPGPSGQQGAKGEAGAQGPIGPKGDTGIPGPITGVLPSGVTERGTFAVRSISGKEFLIDTAISFGLTLPTSVPAFYRAMGAPATTACPGSAAAPSAAPGNLCLYESATKNAEHDADSPIFLDPATTQATTTARPYGVLLRDNSVAVADWYIYGTWAVTAP